MAQAEIKLIGTVLKFLVSGCPLSSFYLFVPLQAPAQQSQSKPGLVFKAWDNPWSWPKSLFTI